MRRAVILTRRLVSLTMPSLVFLLAMVAAGCTHGQRLEYFGPANYPHGLLAVVQVTGGEPEISGEVLAVHEDGLVVLDGSPRVLFVAYDRIGEARFPDAPRLQIGARRAPGPDKRRELRLLSRYPQGIDASLRERLLEAYGLESVVEIR